MRLKGVAVLVLAAALSASFLMGCGGPEAETLAGGRSSLEKEYIAAEAIAGGRPSTDWPSTENEYSDEWHPSGVQLVSRVKGGPYLGLLGKDDLTGPRQEAIDVFYALRDYSRADNETAWNNLLVASVMSGLMSIFEPGEGVHVLSHLDLFHDHVMVRRTGEDTLFWIPSVAVD